MLIQIDGKIVVVGLFDAYNGLVTGRIVRIRGMTSAVSSEGCAEGLTYCGFDNSCVSAGSTCTNTCPADTVQKLPAITPTVFTPQIIPDAGSWNALADSPTAHAAQAMVAVGSKIYVF